MDIMTSSPTRLKADPTAGQDVGLAVFSLKQYSGHPVRMKKDRGRMKTNLGI